MTNFAGDAAPAVIDWRVPATGLDALYGDGATRAEKRLPPVTGFAGAGIVAGVAALQGLDWAWWQYALAVVLVYDLVGGVVAMGLNSAKRFHHATHLPVPRRSAALTRNEVLFSAVHVQPVVIAAVFPGGPLWWGVLWYAVALAGVVLVGRTPLYLARPVALALVAVTPVAAMPLDAPHGFGWLPVVLVAKLVLGSVREEPYRPG